MTKEVVSPTGEGLPIEISLEVQLDPMRRLVFRSLVPVKDWGSALNGVLDAVSAAGDRKVKQYKLEQLRADLVQKQRMYEDGGSAIEVVDRKHQEDYYARHPKAKVGDYKMTSRHEAERKNAQTNIEYGKTIITRIETDIAALEAEIGNA